MAKSSQLREGKGVHGRRTTRTGITLVLLLLLFPFAPTAAAVTCSNPMPSSAEITLTAENDVAIVSIGDPGGNMILVNGSPCGTTATVTTITVAGNVKDGQTLEIDQRGLFVFGDGISWTVDLGDGIEDALIVAGSDASDDIRFGASGINLDAGGSTSDVTLAADNGSVEQFLVTAGDGDDLVSAAGEQGTGSPFAYPLILNGEDGKRPSDRRERLRHDHRRSGR